MPKAHTESIKTTPYEVLREIFVCASFEVGYKSNLCALSLVCRAWREPAQDVLHASVELWDDRQAKAWLTTSAKLRTRTKELFLSRGVGKNLGLQVIAACDGLQALTVQDAPDGGNAWCQQATSIHTLSLRRPGHFPGDAPPLPSTLRTLTLSMPSMFPDRMFDIIFLPSRESLVTLHLLNLNPEGASYLAASIATTTFPHLRTLVLWDSTTSFREWSQIFQYLPALEEIELDSMSEEAMAGLAACDVQRSGIARLVFSRGGETLSPLERLTSLLKKGRWEKLQVIEIRKAPRSEFDFGIGKALLRDCERRGIALGTAYGFITSRHLELEAEANTGALVVDELD